MFFINRLVNEYYIHTKYANNLQISMKIYVIQDYQINYKYISKDTTLFLNLNFHTFHRK